MILPIMILPLRWNALVSLLSSFFVLCGQSLAADSFTRSVRPFLDQHCIECHHAETKKGQLDLTALSSGLTNAETFATWVNVHDRVRAGEMPPEKQPRPAAKELDRAMSALAKELTAADAARQQRDGRSGVRRLTRIEFENTLRDLLDVPGLRVLAELPLDGKSHGFDRAADALPFSFVHQEKYLAAVDAALDLATPAFAERPPVFKFRYAPWHNTRHGGKETDLMISVLIQHRCCIGLVGLERDPTLKTGPWENRFQLFDDEPKSTALGFFRHEDADLRYNLAAAPVLSGWHKLRVSGFSFGWDRTNVVTTDRHGALSWGKKSLGRYGTVDLPPNQAATRELSVWLGRGEGLEGEQLIFNPASCEKIRDFPHDKKTGLGEFGPPCDAQGVAVEWFEIEGPLFEQWPPRSQTALFGDLPVREWTTNSGVPKPAQQTWPEGPHEGAKDIYGYDNQRRPVIHVVSAEPEKDARRLLDSFLKRAFRRPPSAAEVLHYAEIVSAKQKAGLHFQDALKSAYRAALTSPDFLLLKGDGAQALASRLSYLLWAGPPDDALLALADNGQLLKPAVLRAQTERLLADPKSARFIENFTDQWLKLRDIDATVPDKQLYPEFMPIVQDSMLMETRACFAELLQDNLGPAHFVRSDFAMLNEPLARLYGIEGVRGFDIRRVALPKDSPRGGFLTQGAVLKVTANGTTTSPVVRGAFVMEKILGIVPTSPPADAGVIEPDTRGATTIREQLEQHKRNATCASCHVKMDPYGFALESFDVVGASREKYRARGAPNAPTGSQARPVVHGNGIAYHFDKPVDCTGTLPDGRPFSDIAGLRAMLAASEETLARAFVGHFVTYATGSDVGFADRAEVEKILQRAKAKKYGVRTLVHEVVQSRMFREN